MKRLLFILIAIIAVVFAVLLIAPGVIPVSAYKGRIEAAASEAIGRQVTVSDNLSFRIFPRTAFHVETLVIANAEGFEGDYLARVGEADIGVGLFPLIGGSVEVDRFVLTEPDINLVRAADGGVNWNLAAGREQPAEEEAAGRGGLDDVRLGDVRIVDGRARYSDAATGNTYTAEDIDLDVVLKSLSEPLEVDGTMLFQDQPTTIDLVLTTLDNVMQGEPSNLKLDATIGETQAGADLTVETGETVRYSGPIDFNAPNLAAFAALAGMELAEGPGFDRLALSGDVDGGETSLRLSNARIGFDDITAQGALSLDWSGQRPMAGGVLSTDKLDLRPYLPAPADSPEGFPAWSEEKIDFSSLRNIDADFDISTNAIFLNDLEIGESRLKLRVDNGRMTADIPELAMYGGQGSGQFVVNARGATPSLSGNFDMSAVEAQPLSIDLLKHDNLLGLGALNFSFTASGASQAAIMSTLDGEGGFDIADGAIQGVNIAQIARAINELRQGFNPATLQAAVASATSPREATDFSEFLSNFKIADGLVSAPTITLNGPFVTMSGSGTVNLPQQTIDLRLAPRATAEAEGEGGRAITVPLRVGGTFSQPSLGVDAEALIRGEAGETIRGFLEGALGGEQSDAESAEGEAPTEEAEQTSSPEQQLLDQGLDAIFGRKKKQPAEQEEEEPQPEP